MCEKSIKTQDAVLSVSEIEETTGSMRDMCFLGLVFVVVYLFIRHNNVLDMDWFSTFLLMSYVVGSFIYVKGHGYEISRQNIGLFIFILIACFSKGLCTTELLKLCNFIFVNVLQAYWLLSCCKHQTMGKESNWILYDFLISIFRLPWVSFKRTKKFLNQFLAEHGNAGGVLKVLLGLVLSVPLLFVILPLLSSADAEFSHLLMDFLDSIIFPYKYFFAIIAAIPITFYYFSMAFGNVTSATPIVHKHEKIKNIMHRFARIPATVFVTLEAVLAVTYILFICISSHSILQNVGANREVFSYSQYARDGFFELCVIVIINFIILAFIQLLNEKNFTKMNIYMKRVLCIETMAIIVTAFVKMGLYIHTYGLTHLRIYASWFMIVLLGFFILILIHSFKKIPVVLYIVKYACVCFLILNMMNINWLIHTVNTKSSVASGFMETQNVQVLNDDLQ